MSDLLMLAGPAATFIAAGSAVFVTWRIGQGQLRIAEEQKRIAQQQAELAAARLRHDLYDKRFAVYTAVRELINHIINNQSISSEEVIAYARKIDEAAFLFGDDVVSYVLEFNQHATALSGSTTADYGHYQWIVTQYTAVVEKFKPYLTLENLAKPS